MKNFIMAVLCLIAICNSSQAHQGIILVETLSTSEISLLSKINSTSILSILDNCDGSDTDNNGVCDENKICLGSDVNIDTDNDSFPDRRDNQNCDNKITIDISTLSLGSTYLILIDTKGEERFKELFIKIYNKKEVGCFRRCLFS